MGWEVRALKIWNKQKRDIFGDAEAGNKYEIIFSSFETDIPEFTWAEDTVKKAKESATKMLNYFKRGSVEILESDTARFIDFFVWKKISDKVKE